MKFDILTIFPEFFQILDEFSIIGRAIEENIIQINNVNIRDFSNDNHQLFCVYPLKNPLY